MANRQKRDVDCTVHTDDDVADRTDDVADHTLMWQTVIGQLAYDVFCWQRMGRRHVAQSKAATCHLFVGLKALQPAGLDPATSGQGKRLGKGRQPVPPYEPCYIYDLKYI
jgi:hypothetical protein